MIEVALGTIGLILSVLVIYFNLPYSGLKSNFKDYLAKSSENSGAVQAFRAYGFRDLPGCMQKFYRYTGLTNKADSRHVGFDFKDADFVNVEMNKTLKIAYSEHIFAGVPARFAFIDSSLFGIPFQGFDSFYDGKGGMKGVIAKSITLFDQRGEAMDKAALVTWLSESIFMPSEMLSGQIAIREQDADTVEVSVSWRGLNVSGVYKFKDSGELDEFMTSDRAMCYTDGRIEYKKWSALFENYKNQNGLLLPGRLKAVWHLETGDLTYFDGGHFIYTYY